MLLIFLLLQFTPSSAQQQKNLIFLAPETEDFPNISVPFDIINTSNQPIINIDLDQLSLIENKQEVQISEFERIETGVLFALATNPGRDFDIRDSNGVSPYQKMSTKIVNWASSRSFSPDDAWSFVTNDGNLIRNTTSNESWIMAFKAYQPNFRQLESNLTSLEQSIQILQDWTVSFGVDKTLLYITVPPKPEQIAPIRELTQDAIAAGINVSVWMIGDGYYLTNEQGGALMDLASLSGGQFLHYTGAETLPDPELMLSSLGSYYRLTYQSKIRQTGSYPLELTIDLPGGTLSATSTPFYLEVSPPKPILLSPPVTITRKTQTDAAGQNEILEPDNFEINFIIEFPDGRPRVIKESRLYVDDILEDKNDTPPFDALIWDISTITENGEHIIQIEVVDSLGLSSRTIETPIMVEIVTILPAQDETLSRQQAGLLISGGILLAALLILVVWGFRQFWHSPRFSSFIQGLFNRFNRQNKEQGLENDDGSSIYATLIPLNELIKEEEQGNLLHIKMLNTTLGSDGKRAGIRLEGESVYPIHAQIRIRNNVFWLNDLGSSEGTWLNYKKIGTRPVEVKPGDVIHFGNKGFRFTILEGDAPLNVQVQKYEPYS